MQRFAPFTVTIPATSANLGPGFDVMGLAISLYDEIRCEPNERDGILVDITGEGAHRLPTNERNLVARIAAQTLSEFGVEFGNVRLHAVNRIAHARGMGSSAAAAIAGISIAAELLRQFGRAELTKDDVFRRACAIEGHPDNVAPAVYGGATISWTVDGESNTRRIALNPALHVVMAIPASRASTKAAREAMPASVPLTAAVFNIARVALLTETLVGDLSQLFVATDDDLHQPYRAHVMPESAALVAELRSRGLAAIISGAGPSVAVLTSTELAGQDAKATVKQLVDDTWRVEQMSISEKGVTIDEY